MARKNRRFQFTSKRHSTLAAAALTIGIISLLLLIVCVVLSYLNAGDIGKPVVVTGTLGFLLGLVSVALSVQSRRSNEVFMTMPNVSLIISIISSVLWLAVYIYGLFR